MRQHHPARKAIPPADEADLQRSERSDQPGVVRVHTWQAARQVLRQRQRTTQAGFAAEAIPRRFFRHHPILFSDGQLHDQQRSAVARYFAPAVVGSQYGPFMTASAQRLLTQAQQQGECLLEEVALWYAVEVSAVVVGLTHAPVRPMARRLVRLFNQPPFDPSRRQGGRSLARQAQAAVNALVPLALFYLCDVRPAVRSRRRQPRCDVISHLISQGYTNADCAVECVTYASAGMVTTREFISMAAWHLLSDPQLCQQYQQADRSGQLAILAEIIRLEPVVGHLYRRVVGSFPLNSTAEVHPGDLVDVCVRHTNTDPAVMGADAQRLRPGRQVPPGVDPTGLSFGDGAHKCPGQSLAMQETHTLLTALLALEPRLVTQPQVHWDDLIAGYCVRGMRLRFGH